MCDIKVLFCKWKWKWNQYEIEDEIYKKILKIGIQKFVKIGL